MPAGGWLLFVPQVQPDFTTDASCVATYKGAPFTTSAGPVKVASIVGATIK